MINTLTGAERITQERERQIAGEGYTATHDAEHDTFELTEAAEAYLMAAKAAAFTTGLSDGGLRLACPESWPWELEAWKPSGEPIRDLVKAGALIAAEIDRLLALGQRPAGSRGER